MRKTSKYANKRKQQGMVYNGAAWADVVQRSRPYTSENVVPGWNVGATLDTAVMAALRARQAYESLRSGQVAPDDYEPHDLLVQALGVAVIRAAQVGTTERATNEALALLHEATEAMSRMIERHQRLGVWGLDGPALEQIASGLDVYEDLLMASTPAEMSRANDLRMQVLEKQREVV